MDSEAPTLPSPSRTLLVLRLAMTLAWAGITVSLFSSPRVAGRGTAFAVFAGACVLVVLAAMLANLRGAPHVRPLPRTVPLLLVQVAAGILMATDFMFLVAIELPLTLRPRRASIGFAALVTLVLMVGFAEARWGTFFAAPELAGLPWSLQVSITMLMTAGWLALAFAGGLLAATEMRAKQEIGRLMTELRLTNRMLEDTSREAERLRIARELHDTVGHRLAALAVSLDLGSRCADGPPAESLREARNATQQLLGEVRQVVGAIREAEPVDVKRAIARLVSRLGPPDVELIVSPSFSLSEPAASHALLRCAQEALTNVVRHAHATHVCVSLRQDDHGTTLTVRDDGVGAESLREGHGLRGMRERLLPLNGTLRLSATAGEGCELTVTLPDRERAS